MAWDFETEPEFQAKLDWIRSFVEEKIEPLDLVYGGRAFHPLDDETGPLVRPMQDEIKAQGLWAAHLGPELGGKGFGQLKLALINEILGTSGLVIAITIRNEAKSALDEKYFSPSSTH
jgi:acyl-CoA dehydrogenase